MYLRFVCSWRCAHARAEMGLFGPAQSIKSCPEVEPWIRHEIERLMGWFNDGLTIPRVLSRCGRGGLCWFRDDAAEHVSQARYLGWLCSEAGWPIEELRTERPGTVIWSDDHQVVALPERDHPRLFR